MKKPVVVGVIVLYIYGFHACTLLYTKLKMEDNIIIPKRLRASYNRSSY